MESKDKGRGRIGRMGEDAVCEYLMARGHSILERNWRKGHLEIDIITLAPDGIHFVEVKSRTAPAAAPPEENVGWLKQKRIASAAQCYLNEKDGTRLSAFEAFLDVAAVVFDGSSVNIDYFPAAYTPIYT